MWTLKPSEPSLISGTFTRIIDQSNLFSKEEHRLYLQIVIADFECGCIVIKLSSWVGLRHSCQQGTKKKKKKVDSQQRPFVHSQGIILCLLVHQWSVNSWWYRRETVDDDLTADSPKQMNTMVGGTPCAPGLKCTLTADGRAPDAGDIYIFIFIYIFKWGPLEKTWCRRTLWFQHYIQALM